MIEIKAEDKKTCEYSINVFSVVFVRSKKNQFVKLNKNSTLVLKKGCYAMLSGE